MADTHTLITKAYAAFNKRDIDAALALMSEHVSWPKASEGGQWSARSVAHGLGFMFQDRGEMFSL